MKTKNNKSAIIAALLAASLTVLGITACSKETRTEVADKTKDAYQDTKTAVVNGWDKVKSYTFDKRSDFSKELKAQETSFDAQVSRMRADYAEAQASASRKAAMAELKDSESNYKEKLSALGNATSDTWTEARDNVVAAWDRMQASYAKARAEK